MSSEKLKKPIEEETRGTPGWMVTFSDLATLLLTFFVLLLSMSSMDDRTMKSMFTNFTSACGILYFKEFGEIYKPKEVLIEGLYERLQDAVIIKKAGDPVEDAVSDSDTIFESKAGSILVIENIEDGFKLIFGHRLLFDPGKAEIKPEMKEILAKIARFVRASAYQIYIAGHTDSIPIKNEQFASNVDLSLSRAFNIMSYLVRDAGINSASIALGGYGEYRPLAPNDTSIGRAKNRRVEIIFKKKKYY
jgi:chemotaxis protein MotB